MIDPKKKPSPEAIRFFNEMLKTPRVYFNWSIRPDLEWFKREYEGGWNCRHNTEPNSGEPVIPKGKKPGEYWDRFERLNNLQFAEECPKCKSKSLKREAAGPAHVHANRWECSQCVERFEDATASVVEEEAPKQLPEHGAGVL